MIAGFIVGIVVGVVGMGLLQMRNNRLTKKYIQHLQSRSIKHPPGFGDTGWMDDQEFFDRH